MAFLFRSRSFFQLRNSGGTGQQWRQICIISSFAFLSFFSFFFFSNRLAQGSIHWFIWMWSWDSTRAPGTNNSSVSRQQGCKGSGWNKRLGMKSPLLASDKQQAAGSHKQIISQPPLRVDSSLLFLFCGQKSGEKGILYRTVVLVKLLSFSSLFLSPSALCSAKTAALPIAS